MLEMLNRKREVVKPWGKEVIWAETPDYVGKLLYINEGHKLSLQYHEQKEETILVISGDFGSHRFQATEGEAFPTLKLSEGETLSCDSGNTIHQLCCYTAAANVVLDRSINKSL